MADTKLTNLDKTEFTVAFTGHRPDKLSGYNASDNSKLLWQLRNVIEDLIVYSDAKVFITGMAIGIDQWAARVVLKLIEKYPTVRLVCAIPCLDHPNKWPKPSQEEWHDICSKANSIYYVSKAAYTSWCMQARNQWMIDKAHHVVAVWDGTQGGTGNCVAYAEKVGKEITRINPNDYK